MGAVRPSFTALSGAPLVAQTPAAACALADDLARLIDDMTTRGVSWDRLDDLVPDQFDDLLAADAAVSADRAHGLAGHPAESAN